MNVAGVVIAAIDAKRIERQVLADQQRPCLYNVAGPCMHPRCLEAHFQTLRKRQIFGALERGDVKMNCVTCGHASEHHTIMAPMDMAGCTQCSCNEFKMMTTERALAILREASGVFSSIADYFEETLRKAAPR